MNTTHIWRRIFDERRRLLLPLLIAVIVNIAVLLLAVIPLQTAVASAQERAVDAMRELGDARRVDRQLTQAKASKAQADEELRKFYGDVLPRDLATAESTTNVWLTQAAEDAGLTFKGSRFDWDEVRDSRLSRAFSRVTLQGRYANIRRFLYSLETAKEFIVVERVELAQQGDQPTANGVLEVSLIVSTYFVTHPQP